MKKDSIAEQSPKRGIKQAKLRKESITIGMDLGDKTSRYCMLDESGEVLLERGIASTQSAMRQAFGALARCRIAVEVGTHSPWVSRLLKSLGHEVIVANARQVKLITQSTRKDDKLDARTLARLARIDPALLRPIQHRSEGTQLDLLVIRTRAVLVEARTSLVNAVRGFAKAVGERLPKCDADNVDEHLLEAELPAALKPELRPLLEQIASLTRAIKAADERVEQIAARYPETKRLRQIKGVGALIATTFVLTLEQAERFSKSRDVGCYVGLRPKRRDSGETQRQLGISKEGDRYLRKLLVQGAHGIVKRNAPDTDLKRWGLKLAARGGKNARKRAIVAVARKLAILLHRLWISGADYEPLQQAQGEAMKKKARAARREAA